MASLGLQLASFASSNNVEIARTTARSLPVLARYVATLPGLSRSFASVPHSAQKDAANAQPQASAQAVASKRLPSWAPSRVMAVSPLESSLREMQALMPPPFRRMADQMMQMQREMDSLMGAFGMPRSSMFADPWDAFKRVAGPLAEARRPTGPLAAPRVVPLEASEDPEGYTLTAEVPGFDKKDIKVSLSQDGVLTLSGSLEETSEQAGAQADAQAAAPQDAKEGGEAATAPEGEAAKAAKAVKRAPPSFRRYASFSRSVQLPEDVDPAAITATTQNGVLTVRIPKVAAAEPKVREIPVA